MQKVDMYIISDIELYHKYIYMYSIIVSSLIYIYVYMSDIQKKDMDGN
jgi:hypothetical protein